MISEKNYRKTKSDWVGQIPKHWNMIRGRFLFRSKKKINRELQCENLLSLTLQGVLNKDYQSNEGLRPKNYNTYQIFQKDDLVFKMIDLENVRTSRVGLVHEEGIMSPVYLRHEPIQEKINPKFAYWFYYDLYNKEIYNSVGSGVRSSLSSSDLLEIELPVPPIEDQKLISRYLDKKTGQINSLVEKIHDKIELLKEKRTLLINYYVTKGLNSDVEMKCSGIDWVGDIPSHWATIKPKYILNRVTRPIDDDDEVVTCFRDGVVTLRKNRREDGFTFANKEHGYQQIRPGDLVVHEMDGFAGAIGISDSKGKSTPVYTVVEPDSKTNLKFVAYLLRVMSHTGKIESLARSIRERTTDFRWNMWSVIHFPFPQVEEQILIAEKLDEETNKVDKLINLYKEKIDKLLEYSQSLTSSVTTGKLRITEDMI